MAIAVWPTKIAHCFAGAFPFEHAGGEGTLACNTVYRLRGFLFYQGYYCPLCSISTLTYFTRLCPLFYLEGMLCAVAVLG
jgi:hypothetical protein